MPLCDGDARVDIAVANYQLCGYEIKSDADSLERLSSQKYFYKISFDRITIAVGNKFENIIDNHIPDFWGLYV